MGGWLFRYGFDSNADALYYPVQHTYSHADPNYDTHRHGIGYFYSFVYADSKLDADRHAIAHSHRFVHADLKPDADPDALFHQHADGYRSISFDRLDGMAAHRREF